MTQRTSRQHVVTDIEKLIRARRGKRRSTNRGRLTLMIRVSEIILEKFQVRPSAWQPEHIDWLWKVIEERYSEKTAYGYKCVAREVAKFYGTWFYLPKELATIRTPTPVKTE